MTFWERITRSNFIIRLKSWEYWPFSIVQFPLFLYWLWLSLRARSLFFFTASNPGILTGGMFGESKFEVLKKIPPPYLPKAALIKLPATPGDIINIMRGSDLQFPLIFKPDIGERGWMVKRINNEREAVEYLAQCKVDIIAQELIDLPLEFGVYYMRFPGNPQGEITSIVAKEMLHITGDGKSTLQELILQKDRAKLQWKKLRFDYGGRLDEILPKGQKLELVSIGNHCLGTMFTDGSHLINPKLSQSFDSISRQIDGFYFGRFDLRTASISDLNEGKVQIMELNGCGAEPAHIYHPGNSLRMAFAVLFKHWHDLFLISVENHKRGVNYMPLKEGITIFRRFRSIVK
jgi:hypothetical protein